MREAFRDVDVIVTPTVATDPPCVRSTDGLPPDEAFARLALLGAFTAVLNASGMPGVTVPVRVDGHPLPVGVQLIGRQGDDGRLLALARAVLEALGTPLAPTA
jgi:amidase